MKMAMYEDNGGGITMIIRDNRGKLENVILGLEFCTGTPSDFWGACMEGWWMADDYDPDKWGLTAEEMAAGIEDGSIDCILKFDDETGEGEIYISQMGANGHALLGLQADIWYTLKEIDIKMWDR